MLRHTEAYVKRRKGLIIAVRCDGRRILPHSSLNSCNICANKSYRHNVDSNEHLIEPVATFTFTRYRVEVSTFGLRAIIEEHFLQYHREVRGRQPVHERMRRQGDKAITRKRVCPHVYLPATLRVTTRSSLSGRLFVQFFVGSFDAYRLPSVDNSNKFPINSR